MAKSRSGKLEILKSIPKIKKSFKSHSHLCDFLDENIKDFSDNWLGGSFKKYKKEWYLGRGIHPKFGNKPRIDFMIEMEDGRRIGIECKKVHHAFNESVKAPSQLLAYGVLAEKYGNPFDEMILLVDKVDITTVAVIKKYKLPIRYMIISEDCIYEARWEGYEKR